MNQENHYGFQQLVDLCKQTHHEMQQQILQALSAVSRMDDISQRSADQVSKSHINPVEFDGIRMQINREIMS